MTLILPYKFKKDIPTGKHLEYEETSMFGEEYPNEGNGSVTGCNRRRQWFARITLDNHIITEVA